jgi:hypothetical protein
MCERNGKVPGVPDNALLVCGEKADALARLTFLCGAYVSGATLYCVAPMRAAPHILACVTWQRGSMCGAARSGATH